MPFALYPTIFSIGSSPISNSHVLLFRELYSVSFQRHRFSQNHLQHAYTVAMGVCVSKQEACVGRLPGKHRRRLRRRPSSRKSDFSITSDPSFRTPTFQAAGSVDAAWFDCFPPIDYDGDDDFHSFREDVVSWNDSVNGTISSTSSPRVVNSTEHPENTHNPQKRPKEFPYDNGGGSSASEVSKNVNMAKVQPKDSDSTNGCLSCLASTANKKTLTSGTSNLRKRVLSKLSFKLQEGSSDQPLISPKGILRRPIAGSSVPYSPKGKRIPDSWSPIDPNTFKVRGKNFLKDKKKDFAPNLAAFHPFGVDVFLSQRKIDHIARFVELPSMNSAEEIPSFLVVNIQVPLYPTALFQSENDGEGISLVLYFKISETYSCLPPSYRENIKRLINDEVERVKAFPLDHIQPFRERLKILGRMANVEDLHLSAAEKKLLNAYNEKPVLSRPQHEFYLGENYLEIDLDVHRFSYISRRGFETFHDRIKLSVLDFGLTIQGNKVEDLPEHLLCCIRLNEVDFTNYHQLGF